MMSTTNATRSIDLSQRTLFHFASVYQRINYVRSLRHLVPEIQQALDSFEVFRNELITAIERHPTADTSDVLKRVFDIEQPFIEVDINEQTVVQFIDACGELNSISEDRGGPFADMILHSMTWFPEFIPGQGSN